MEILNFPREIILEILDQAFPSWDWPRRYSRRQKRAIVRGRVKWFLSLRLVSRLFGDLIIALFLRKTRDGYFDNIWPRHNAPPSESKTMFGRRIFKEAMNTYSNGCDIAIINRIHEGVRKAADFLAVAGCASSSSCSDSLRTIYLDGAISLFPQFKGLKYVIHILVYPDRGTDLGDWDMEGLESTEIWRMPAIMIAAYLGRLDDLRLLAFSGLESQAIQKDYYFNSPLVAAALGGHVHVMKYLIEQGADPDFPLCEGEGKILHFAARGGHTSAVGFCLDIGAAADSENDDDETPLLIAAAVGHVDVVKLLLAREADINHGNCYNPRPDLLYPDRPRQRTAAIWASIRGHQEVVEELVQCPDLEFGYIDPDEEGLFSTILGIAAGNGREAILELLLAHSREELNLETAFKCALIGGNLNIVKTIISRFPKAIQWYEEIWGETVLMGAAAEGSEEVVRYLLYHEDLPVNSQDNQGMTALHFALRSNSLGKVKAILEHPYVDVNLPNSEFNRESPLNHIAGLWPAYSGPWDLNMMKALLAHPRIDINSQNIMGQPPLTGAIQTGQVDLVKLLITCKDVNINLADNHGDTPLIYAASGEDYQGIAIRATGFTPVSVDLLLDDPGVDVWHVSDKGHTALSRAALAGRWAVVERLLDPELGATKEMVQAVIERALASRFEGLQYIDKDRAEETARGREVSLQKVLELIN